VIVQPGEGTSLRGPTGGTLRFKVRGEDTDGTITAFTNEIPPGQGPPLHTHANEDESWYVLEGEFRFKFGDDIQPAPAGSFVFIPRGTPHCCQNVGSDWARMLVMFTPSGMERFYETLFPSLKNGPDPVAFGRFGEPLGTHVVGPTLAESDPL
jgi:quercetin dioxygenase-like cupin family protein